MKKPSAFNQVLGPGPPKHRACLIGPLLDLCGLGSSPDRLVPLAVRSPDKFTGPQILWIRAFLILFVSVPKIINLVEPNRTPVKLKFICADLSPGRFSCRTRGRRRVASSRGPVSILRLGKGEQGKERSDSTTARCDSGFKMSPCS